MEVKFRTNELQQAFEKHAKGVKLWGDKVSRRYVERVQVLQAANSADELFKIPPLKFHPLTADRKGQYSLVLKGRTRMMVTFEDPAMTVVWIEEVSKHYGD